MTPRRLSLGAAAESSFPLASRICNFRVLASVLQAAASRVGALEAAPRGGISSPPYQS